MALQRAHITRDILIWARETRGFSVDQAAKSIGGSPSRILQWEAGEAGPTVKQLRKIANAYKRAIGLFFLPERPLEESIEDIRDFRKHITPETEDLSPQLLLEIRLARERRQEAIELAQETGERVAGVLPENHTLRQSRSGQGKKLEMSFTLHSSSSQNGQMATLPSTIGALRSRVWESWSLPDELKPSFEEVKLTAKLPWDAPKIKVDLGVIRHAVVEKTKLRLDYKNEQGKRSQRVVNPMELRLYPPWVLIAWCEPGGCQDVSGG